jgi:putative sigma-54 modulation protein
MNPTDAVKGYATDKIGRLQKFLRQPMKGQVTLSCQHRQHTAEVDLHAGSAHFYAHESSEDMYATIDMVIEKLERQIRGAHVKHKGGERASQKLLPGDQE